MLEMALLTDVIARRAERDGTQEVFEARLLTELEKKPAGVLIGRLRSLGYEPVLAARLDAAIAERNSFVHHLFEEPEMMRALSGLTRLGFALASRSWSLRCTHCWPSSNLRLTLGWKASLIRSAVQLQALLGEADPTEFGEGREREQLEALRDLPAELLEASPADPKPSETTQNAPAEDTEEKA